VIGENPWQVRWSAKAVDTVRLTHNGL